MVKSVKHYKRDGTEFKGATHKMPDGSLHSGKTHGKTSVKLFHFEDLSKTAKEKAMPGYKMNKAKTPAKKKKKAAPAKRTSGQGGRRVRTRSY